MDHINIRRVLESTDPSALVKPATAPTPHIAPDSFPNTPYLNQLDDEAKTQIFLLLCKQYFGVRRTNEIISECATELEVYGLISNAEKVKKICHNLSQDAGREKLKRPSMLVALKIATIEGSDLAKRYMEIEMEEHRILNEIYEQFDDAAMTTIRNLLGEFQRKAMLLNGPNGRIIQEMLSNMGA